ncbi:glycosyltransferase [Arthrobacter agilis]|uniref:glycosyltransferase n=1 Tax=Arthrobacter agilis TaxID=37921 RepID=UPI000B34E9BC|nr:glycosyltransferase [Arthrobacter agilis]OUM44200.1 glycosyl transferase [Arthrobacter agilis]PPB46574.1 glycosyltransferase family 1 protein [Arthrobacter agilis]TPV23768.1 glycosyltransferase [Arthrobacter agilis]VDR32499.1 Glycosyl transferases group 1 [Arthrobacter agilis]
MRILLWHVHGGWTDAFVRGAHTYVLPTTPDGGPWGLGRASRPWPASVVEVAPAALADADIDVVVLQRVEEIAECERLLGRVPGRDLPAVFLEHNTPRRDTVGTVHPLAGQTAIPIIHVTHFNELFWDSGVASTTVIEHGIVDPGYLYTGEVQQLAAVINEPVRRGRITGTDLLPRFAGVAPLEVFGMGTDGLGDALDLGPAELRIGGDLPTGELHARLGRSRAYVHPLRWTSLGLSLLEAMHVGLPVLALATTEAARAVPPGAGAVSTRVEDLVRTAARLMADPNDARSRGLVAREAALERYGLARFLGDWDAVLEEQPARTRVLAVGERRTQ